MMRTCVTMLVLCLVPLRAWAVEGYVLYTRGSDFCGMGTLRLATIGGATKDIDANVGSANFSPDGNKVVYVRKASSTTEIVLANRDGSNKQVLKAGYSADSSKQPKLSWRIPNKIVLAKNQDSKAYYLDLGDSNREKVFHTSPEGQALWSVSVPTNGTRILFYTRSIKRGIWKADVNGKGDFVHSGCGNWISPDGKRFTNNLSTHQDMYIRNWDKSVYKEFSIKATGEYWNNQKWSNNSNGYILYARGKDFQLPQYSNVWVMDVESGKQTQITADNKHDCHRDFWVKSGGSAGDSPMLAVSGSPAPFQTTEGGDDPPDKGVFVTNSGGGSLSAVTVSDDAQWLTVEGSGPGNTQTLTNKVSIKGLSAGSYGSKVTISGGGADNSVSYTVKLEVGEALVASSITVSPATAKIAPEDRVGLTSEILDQHGDPMTADTNWSVSGGGTLSEAKGKTTTFRSDGSEGAFVVEARSGSLSSSATITVEAGANNQPPQVEAGEDLTISLDQVAKLVGEVSDDGLPSPEPTVRWRKKSGPGDVVFVEASQAETEVTFAVDGSYVLELTADDGALQASDAVAVAVTPGQGPSISVVSPSGGESWIVGATEHIRWTTVGSSDVTIEYSIDEGLQWKLIEPSVDDSQAGWMDYEWAVPEDISSSAVIRISDYLDHSLQGESQPFEIVGRYANADGGAGDVSRRELAGDPTSSSLSGEGRLGGGCGVAAKSVGREGALVLLALLIVLRGQTRRRRRRQWWPGNRSGPLG